jgi:hypothetical protein
MYDTFRERMKNYDKSHLVTIKTPTQITAHLFEIVFRYVESHVGIVRRFLISKKGYVFKSHLNSVEITLSTILRQLIFDHEDSVCGPQTL